jgi:NTP pyrophosphatase (non-canonical NTP hydrolase)
MTQHSGDALRDLTKSTLEFYQRFDIVPQVNDCIQNFQEEASELIEAAQQGNDQNHIAEEAADVFVTAIGLCYASGVDVERLIAQVYKVIAKNDAKTHETHAYSDGKIRRRQG